MKTRQFTEDQIIKLLQVRWPQKLDGFEQRPGHGQDSDQWQYHASAGLFRREVGEVPDASPDQIRQWQTVN